MVLIVTTAIVLIILIVTVVIYCVRKKKNDSESGSQPNLICRSDIDYNSATKRAPSNYYLSPREDDLL